MTCFTWYAEASGDYSNSHSCFPITINLLHTLKTQLSRSTSYTPLEQRLLWVAFSLAFYGFMRVSEFTSPSSSNSFSSPGLHCSDVELQSSPISLTLCQSKTDPFHRSHCITITATKTSTCPVHTLQCYVNLIPPANRSGPLFNGGRFAPLSKFM